MLAQAGGRVHEFVNQPAQVDRGIREEMMEKFRARVREVPGLDAGNRSGECVDKSGRKD